MTTMMKMIVSKKTKKNSSETTTNRLNRNGGGPEAVPCRCLEVGIDGVDDHYIVGGHRRDFARMVEPDQDFLLLLLPNSIASSFVPFLKSLFLVDFFGCLPWDAIYKAFGRKEAVRYLLWIRLSRACRVIESFEKLEKDIQINYLFIRIMKLLVVELYCTHMAACIFYFLATNVPPSEEGYTWIGSLKLGDYSFSHFREIDLWMHYTMSLYFAIVTMATVGYGEIHAVNVREMMFIMIYVLFDMIIGAYLIDKLGNTPLLDAIKKRHDHVAFALFKAGASLTIDDAGGFLCTTVAKWELDILKRVLANGINSNSKNYDHRTPLYIAVSEDLYSMAKLLIEVGASVLPKDRYNLNT
ncbi:hypothetical protein ACOSQ3_026193 [Xanthoceras sorbifolium]